MTALFVLLGALAVGAMGLIAWLLRERGRLRRELGRARNSTWGAAGSAREAALQQSLEEQQRESEVLRAAATRSAEELAQANEELRRHRSDRDGSDRTKDEFLAILSHELRNPIHAIQTNAFLLRTRTRDGELLRPIQAIERQVERLTTLVDDLLDVVRVSQRSHLAFETVGLQQVVVAAVEAVRKRADVHRREVGVILAPEELFVKADRGRLEQAVANLVDNAIKYTPQQGSVSIAVRREGERAVVAVRDEGIGIPPEELPHLFDLFSRGASARKHSLSGLGIGLHIARELVVSHGGSLEARSDGPGKGAEFIIRLPLSSERPAAVPREEEPSGTPALEAGNSPLSILVIDDNHDAADSLHDVLEVHGHDVRAAYDGESALNLVRQRPPQVALVDIGMPSMDGYEVARRVNSLPGPKPVLVALTGWGSQSDKQQAKEAGFAYHLTKPLDYDSLAALLATVSRKVAATR